MSDTNRRDILEVLMNACCDFLMKGTGCLGPREWQAAASEILALREKTRWIPVGERLPEGYKTVIISTSFGVSAGEVRFPDSECGMDGPWWMVFKQAIGPGPSWAGLVEMKDVTHWMPLPAPPQPENQEP